VGVAGAGADIGIKERELFLSLLNLTARKAPKEFLRDALGLLIELSNARRAYIELYDDDAPSETPRWSMAHALSADDIQSVRAVISRGIIAEAIATGQTIATASALLDPRFSGRDSVRAGSIEAVLCAPIGEDPPRGVLYLQGATTAGMFPEE